MTITITITITIIIIIFVVIVVAIDTNFMQIILQLFVLLLQLDSFGLR